MIYGYARVGNGKNTIETQRNQIKHYAQKCGANVDEWFLDSVKEGNPNAYHQLKEQLKSGDTVIITDVDRLNKNWSTVISEYHDFSRLNVNLMVVHYETMNLDITRFNETIDYKTHQESLIEVYCNSIIHERKKISEITKEALATLQKQGVQLGRPKKYDHDQIIKMYLSGRTYDEISEESGASRAMISKIVKRHGIQRRRPNGYRELDK